MSPPAVRCAHPFPLAAVLGAFALSACSDPKRDALRELGKRGVEISASSLLAAVRENDADTTRLLLQSGVYPAQRDAAGNTPLHLALDRGMPGIAFLLIDHGADLDAATPAGVTPVSLAVFRDETAAASRLLDRGANPEGLTPDGERILPWAIRHGRLVFVRHLLDGGADPHQKDSAGTPLIHVAIEAGRRDLALELLERGADPAMPSARGESLLAAALRMGWHDWLDELVRAGADPNLPDRDGMTLLDAALAERNFDLVRRLGSLGAKPAGGRWEVPLWQALQRRDRETLGHLLALGAPPDARDASGRRPAEYAIDADDGDALHLLLAYGADTTGLFERTRRPGRRHLGSLPLAHGAIPAAPPPPSLDTPLGLAIRAGDFRTVRLLLDRGAPLAEPLGEGQTPLALAVALGRSRIAGELLARGAASNAPLLEPVRPAFLQYVSGGTMRWLLRNDRNITPIMLAADSGCPETAKTLLAAGARTSVWTQRNRMWPINIAARKSDVKMMRVLLGKDPHVEQRRIVVSLSEQKAWLYDAAGAELFSTRISTGRKGFATPTGTFAITNKYRSWTSTIYAASMPYFQRFSCGDFGFHQGVVPGYPASHGCIRVPAGNATKLFALTELGDRVEIQP